MMKLQLWGDTHKSPFAMWHSLTHSSSFLFLHQWFVYPDRLGCVRVCTLCRGFLFFVKFPFSPNLWYPKARSRAVQLISGPCIKFQTNLLDSRRPIWAWFWERTSWSASGLFWWMLSWRSIAKCLGMFKCPTKRIVNYLRCPFYLFFESAQGLELSTQWSRPF